SMAEASMPSEPNDLPRRLHPAPQGFGDAPGLGDAAARGVGRLGVEDFADGTDALLVQVRHQALQKPPRLRGMPGVQFQPGVDVGTDQPRPYRALMIGGVARTQVAVIL